MTLRTRLIHPSIRPSIHRLRCLLLGICAGEEALCSAEVSLYKVQHGAAWRRLEVQSIDRVQGGFHRPYHFSEMGFRDSEVKGRQRTHESGLKMKKCVSFILGMYTMECGKNTVVCGAMTLQNANGGSKSFGF
ncbi:hypothetical protein NQZ68_034421 [Dissostichus eleginoides]|nr:hypothetical protein NQZ68_034421 [Dissostichus eleginoides]